VRLDGEDAGKLLQGLITNDMELLVNEPAMHAALLSPQGKILFEFFVVAMARGFLLETARATAPQLVERLGLYKLRAKLKIADASADYRVFALWGESLPTVTSIADGAAFVDPRLPDLGWRIVAPLALADETQSLPGTAVAAAADWHRHRIALGVPEGGRDYRLGDTFLHEANYDQLGGVSFSKGCFIGQEVASRMQHRGGGRKRVIPVEGNAPLKAGAPVQAGAVALGWIGSVSGTRALALIRLDRAAEALAGGATVAADGVALCLKKPSWARFQMATGAATEAP
jgi:folate-binding protein YgfZ